MATLFDQIQNLIVFIEEVPLGSVNGINSDFALSQTPLGKSANVTLNGVRQYVLSNPCELIDIDPVVAKVIPKEIDRSIVGNIGWAYTDCLETSRSISGRGVPNLYVLTSVRTT